MKRHLKIGKRKENKKGGGRRGRRKSRVGNWNFENPNEKRIKKKRKKKEKEKRKRAMGHCFRVSDSLRDWDWEIIVYFFLFFFILLYCPICQSLFFFPFSLLL